MTKSSLGLAVLLLGLLGAAILVFAGREPASQAAAVPGAQPAAGESIVFGMGCFWGAEKRMSALPGVLDVASGYAGGDYADPTYRKVLANEGQHGVRNYAEVVEVTFDPKQTSLVDILKGFWENHDPTQGDRQGNDIGSNYRSTIYYSSEAQHQAALATRDAYQKALTAAGYGPITTEIAPLEAFYPAEDYHQDYLVKNPNGYCGLGGTGVEFPDGDLPDGRRTGGIDRDEGKDASRIGDDADSAARTLDPATLSSDLQLIAFEAEDCPYCALFQEQVLNGWSSQVPIATTNNPRAPKGFSLEKPLWATPTIVLFREGKEVSRYTGYTGDAPRFWQWLGVNTLSKEQIRVAFEQGTELPFSGSLLDNQQPGTYVDPVTGAPLFRSGTKFKSGTGWPSFFEPVEGAVTMHPDDRHGMHRIEVKSASSGIHLGHVFDDGPPPTGKRYCINSSVLRFVADADQAH